MKCKPGLKRVGQVKPRQHPRPRRKLSYYTLSCTVMYSIAIKLHFHVGWNCVEYLQTSRYLPNNNCFKSITREKRGNKILLLHIYYLLFFYTKDAHCTINMHLYIYLWFSLKGQLWTANDTLATVAPSTLNIASCCILNLK